MAERVNAESDRPASSSEVVKSVQLEAKRLVKALEPLAAVRPGRADTLDALTAAVKKLPAGEEFAAAVEKLRATAEEAISAIQEERQEGFGRCVAAYIGRAREAGTPISEASSGWRVGPLLIELDHASARARACYNHEVVVGWNPVSSADDLQALEQQALKALESKAIPEASLPELFLSAYRNAPSRAEASPTVPIDDFLMQLRVELFRQQLAGRPDRRVAATALAVDMPLWAFLYNIDRYRALPVRDGQPRLGFQSCAMRETQQGHGVTINGLRPTDDYRRVCYVTGTES